MHVVRDMSTKVLGAGCHVGPLFLAAHRICVGVGYTMLGIPVKPHRSLARCDWASHRPHELSDTRQRPAVAQRSFGMR
jgi:hypothetical protein